jgi:3D (Asp-Asp-Asp) domain-containing protein
MDINQKLGEKIILFFIIAGILVAGAPLFELCLIKANEGEKPEDLSTILKENKLVFLEGNSLFPVSNPSEPAPKVVGTIPVVVTAYSSTPQETDDDPFITAAGTWVREGIIANNYLPFGTKVKIPELYGDKIFTVEDRMNRKKGNYHVDIWFASYWDAKEFGAKRTYIEILEI